ncbi:MAG: hypothetical protein JNK64_03075 [Myxococcales bacterium]|nr:hypothetical protein [Myxococcales bacterium]
MATTTGPYPTARRASDLTAHANLDDDGNPLRPLDPDPPDAPDASARVVAAVQTRPLTAIALASGGGALLAWLVAGRRG